MDHEIPVRSDSWEIISLLELEAAVYTCQCAASRPQVAMFSAVLYCTLPPEHTDAHNNNNTYRK